MDGLDSSFYLNSFLDSLGLTVPSDLRGSLNKFPDFFRVGTFIDSTHVKL